MLSAVLIGVVTICTVQTVLAQTSATAIPPTFTALGFHVEVSAIPLDGLRNTIPLLHGAANDIQPNPNSISATTSVCGTSAGTTARLTATTTGNSTSTSSPSTIISGDPTRTTSRSISSSPPNYSNSSSHTHAALDGSAHYANQFPATLLLCESADCSDCSGWEISSLPTNECLAAGFRYISVAIDQPSNAGMSLGVLNIVGGCGDCLQIPQVNTCYNIKGTTVFADFAISI
ncbi:hypothetical protein BD413DRAFT_611793 [Trametes elegans]|nr:hypothetical protein BD413DRAFT_611793 [Trametes elegans]